MTTRARAVLDALWGFLHGFVGSTRVGHDPDGVRRALAIRADARRSCC